MSRSTLFLVLVAVCAIGLIGAADARSHHRRSNESPRADAIPTEINSTTVDAALSAWRASMPMGGVYGLDLSVAATTTQYKCLVAAGYKFTIVRAWRSLCAADANAGANIDAAWAGGMSHVDVYLFPQRNCALTATQQVTKAIDSIAGHKFGTLWLDIEASGSNWSSDVTVNLAWIKQAINAAIDKIGASRVGIYSSKSNWQTITKNDPNFGHFPMWYGQEKNKKHTHNTTNKHTQALKQKSAWNETIPNPPICCHSSMKK